MEANNIPDDFDNLERYAPALFKLGRKNPFTVPEGYFETLPEIVSVVNSIKAAGPAEFSKEVPEGYFDSLPSFIQSQAVLSDIKKENTFVVPADYFDYLPARIQERIFTKQENWLSKIIEKIFSPRFAYAFSFILIVALTGTYLLKQKSSSIDTTVTLSELSKKELTETANNINLDETFLIDELSESNVDMDESLEKENDEEIVNYLIENNVDINTLIKEM